MNIIFLTAVRIDDIASKGIYTDLLKQFKKEGHNLYIVSPREKRVKKSTEYYGKDRVHYLNVKTGNLTKTNLIEKGISTLTVETQFLKAIQKYFKKTRFDLIISSTPPIMFSRIIQFIKKRDGAKSYLLLKDIFPQNAVDLGMFGKNSLIYRYFRQKEKKLYRNSDYIGCMSQANVDFILRHNPELNSDVIEVCPNSIEVLNVGNDDSKKRQIRDKYGIPRDKTVFIYGGNLGKPQGIDFLIECLKSNSLNDLVYFVIAGSGTEFHKLKGYFDSEKPKNAQLFSQLPKEDYESLANSCDVGLIFLDRRFTIPNFPSRILSYMQASMPVLAATDVNTDIGSVIEEGFFGYWCESGDIEKFNNNLLELCNKDLRKQLGTNARRYLEKNYTAKHSYDIIISHFQ